MSIFANPFLFTQIGLDSGALTQLGMVAHQFPEAGNYRGVVYLGADIAATFTLCVDADSTASQANIDLASIGKGSGSASCSDADSPTFTVNPTGYALFHVGSGSGGYSATVGTLGETPIFDTKVLQSGDLFTATLLRPGVYAARCKGVADCRIVVGYPSGGGKVAYRPPDPARIVVSSGHMKPDSVELKPAQPVVFEIQHNTRIAIELVTPDDGPRAAKGT